MVLLTSTDWKRSQKILLLLRKYHTRSILLYSPSGDKDISQLFEEFVNAIEIWDGSKAGTRSAVATAKALHLLGPDCSPLWDEKIARAYGCDYFYDPSANYLKCMRLWKHIAATLQPAMEGQNTAKSSLK